MFYPRSYNSLWQHLKASTNSQKLALLRDLTLLPRSGLCSQCDQETQLDTPTNDAEVKKYKYTMCKTIGCPAKSYNSKRTLHFKRGSIFEYFWSQDMDLIVCAIFCFVLMLPPSTAALLIGHGISADTVGRVYSYVRRACQLYNNKHHRGKLGGTVVPTDSRFPHAVNVGGRYRVVVEYDERRCVCDCVCACWHACVHTCVN